VCTGGDARGGRAGQQPEDVNLIEFERAGFNNNNNNTKFI